MKNLPPAAPDVLTLARSFAQATREHLARLRDGERKVREDGDLEGVHLMRTSCRRLRATLKYLGDPLPRGERKSLKKDLSALMTALGEVRDLDVLRRTIDTVPDLGSPEAEELKEAVEERLSRAATRMDSVLDGEEYPALLESLEKATQVADDGIPVTWSGPDRTAAALSETLRLKPADWASAPEASLHDLRKSVKRIRYALEAFAPAYGRPVAKAIERCRDLQESLGVIQDASAFAGQLKGIQTFSAGQFIATIRARATSETGRLPELWEKAFGTKAAARLGAHLFRRAVRSEPPPADQKARRKVV
ncbi:MAG TPA: CHAD domain-containing protein [Planctomycetota bacterium]|nr:CHAD domain-containing protein [Planctomycetota bacterium]